MSKDDEDLQMRSSQSLQTTEQPPLRNQSLSSTSRSNIAPALIRSLDHTGSSGANGGGGGTSSSGNGVLVPSHSPHNQHSPGVNTSQESLFKHADAKKRSGLKGSLGRLFSKKANSKKVLLDAIDNDFS